MAMLGKLKFFHDLAVVAAIQAARLPPHVLSHKAKSNEDLQLHNTQRTLNTRARVRATHLNAEAAEQRQTERKRAA